MGGHSNIVVNQLRDHFDESEVDAITAVANELLARQVHDAAAMETGLGYVFAEFLAAKSAITQKHAALGGAPGKPTAMLQVGNGEGFGFRQEYESSSIYWRRDIGAWWVHGAIYTKYIALGGEDGKLGYPVTDEDGTADGVGRFTRFVHGSISYHPAVGVFAVRGDICVKWLTLGAEALGFPAMDETSCGDQAGRFSRFRSVRLGNETPDSSIYWRADLGPVPVIGRIRDRWLELGAETSYLGYPISDERAWYDPDSGKAGRISFFERGAIGYIFEDKQVLELPDRVVLKSGHVGVSSVGGWVELVASSAGTYHYRGHMHNSGFVAIQCTVGSVIVIPGFAGLTVQKEFDVGGTLAIDDRDQDWSSPSGYDPLIRQHWDAIRTQSSLVTSIKAELGAESFFTLIFFPVLAGLLIYALLSADPPEGQKCQTGDMHTVTDGNNRLVTEPTSVRCFPAKW